MKSAEKEDKPRSFYSEPVHRSHTLSLPVRVRNIHSTDSINYIVSVGGKCDVFFFKFPLL